MNILRVIFVSLLIASTAVAETRVRILGMQSKSENQALEALGGRLTHVRNSSASAPLADDAAFLLRQVLRKDGYVAATVEWKIAAHDEIRLTVHEGGRLSLGKVTVLGVAADETRKLARLYAKPAEKDRLLGASAPPFREEDVETGLSFLTQEFHARGHWSAEARVQSRVTDAASGKVDLVIEMVPGPVFSIVKPAVQSVDGRGVKLTALAAQPFVGEPATTGNLNAMRVAVEEAVVAKGYPDAKIEMARKLENAGFQPIFSISLGVRVKLNRIRIAGLQRTDPERIAARMKVMEGEWYDEAAMNKRMREMLATGAFSTARVETSVVGERRVDATLHFDEARAREISLAAGLGSYQGLITRATYADRNLWGKLLGFSAGLEISSRGVLGDVRLTDPWVMGSDVSATARGYSLIYSREGYDTLETGVSGEVLWKFGKHYQVNLLLGQSIVNLSEDGLPSSELGETVYGNPRICLTQELDYRDNRVLPTKGWHLQSPIEIGAAVGDMSTSYVKAGVLGGWFHEINRRYQVGVGGEWGVLVPSGDGEDLPIELRRFNGGPRSVRSFPERELGPSVAGYPTGGEAMWNTNFEIIRSLGGAVKAVGFVDAGALSREVEGLASHQIEIAAGLGIRLDLPIGPVRLEYGYNLTRDPGEPAGTLHFAIGYAY